MMKYVIYLLAFCFPWMLSAQQTKQLFILQTSDTHSRIEPVSDHAASIDAGKGGIVRRTSFVKQYRAMHPQALLFDCGDISQGTPYYNLFKGELEIKAMNLMGYDAMTIGNHEFDFGMENMARLFKMAQFPVLCANYDFTGTVLEGLVKPYVVLQREGLRIGVFGISPQLAGLVQASKCEGVCYKDPIATAQQMATLLRQQEHCDVVICLSHLGIQPGTDAEGEYDNALVCQTRDIDLILGGHTHTFMEQPAIYKNMDGEDVGIMHVGRNGVFVGETVLSLHAK